VDMQQLTAEYDSKSDEQLLRLALNAEQLTPEAKSVLANELAKAKRQINTNHSRGLLLPAKAISGLSRVRTKLWHLRVIPSVAPHPEANG
jgi:hypothetical protein